MSECPHCGLFHTTTCPRIRALEYHDNGTLKRVEFHEPPIFPTIRRGAPNIEPPVKLHGSEK